MKKYRKLTRIISLVFALCMLMSVTGIAVDVNDVIPITASGTMELQAPAVEAYQNIWKSFAKDENGSAIWPDEFAGEYIDSMRGYKLVIKLTDTSEEMQKKYIERSGNADCLLFEKAAYSLNYLESLKGYVDELSKAGYSVLWWVASKSTNTLRIVVDQSDYAKVLETFDTKGLPINIEQGDPVFARANLVGGAEITNASSGGSMSIGIGGTYTTGGNVYSNCILTCGHLNPVGSKIRYNGSETGTVLMRSYSINPSNYVNGDYAIVRLTANTGTNDVKISSTATVNIQGMYSTMPLNMYVIKYGKEGGYAHGNVTETGINLSYQDDTTFVRNITQVTISGSGIVSAGDSGGPVYTQRPAGNYWLCGIVTAGGPPYDDPIGSSATRCIYVTPLECLPSGFVVRTS